MREGKYPIGSCPPSIGNVIIAASQILSYAAHLPRNNEGDGFDRRTSDFVCTSNFAIGNTQCTSGKEAHAALGI